jgi:acetoin utilization deacetylase AcuC-like enzyme
LFTTTLISCTIREPGTPKPPSGCEAETPERLRSIVRHLKESRIWKSVGHLAPEPAREEDILRVHTKEHLNFVRRSCEEGMTILDAGDTHVSRDSFAAARLAAGGVITAAKAVAEGSVGNAFCAVRPPGHHAGSNYVMGFCLFNNAAIAARYLQAVHGLKRVAIVDWDVHHGNGTQDIFYEDGSVFYISLHQYPYYPGTGSREERGKGQGAGATLNFPMDAGCGDAEYNEAFERELVPSLDRYRPEMIILSAGFDAHRDDPLASINLTEDSFARFTRLMKEVAHRTCEGKILSLLEGGYNLDALGRSVVAHVSALLEK